MLTSAKYCNKGIHLGIKALKLTYLVERDYDHDDDELVEKNIKKDCTFSPQMEAVTILEKTKHFYTLPL